MFILDSRIDFSPCHSKRKEKFLGKNASRYTLCSPLLRLFVFELSLTHQHEEKTHIYIETCIHDLDTQSPCYHKQKNKTRNPRDVNRKRSRTLDSLSLNIDVSLIKSYTQNKKTLPLSIVSWMPLCVCVGLFVSVCVYIHVLYTL